MIQKFYKICLMEDCIVSAVGATELNHRTLPYLPGSLFMGYAVNRIGFDARWVLSGTVRFQNAYPLTSNRMRSYPIPFCWHKPKNNSLSSNDTMTVIDKLHPKTPEDQQTKQLREGFVAGTEELKVKMNETIKTAIDRDKYGSSQESMLFAYQTLAAGQSFLFILEADDAEQAIIERIDALFKNETILLGRSRSAEFGRVTVGSLSEEDWPKSPEIREDKQFLYLYFLSDTMLLNTSLPVFTIDPTALGISGMVVPDRTFIRTRRYSPWNAAYNCRMEERPVICAGSVVTIQCEQQMDKTKLVDIQNRLIHGIGCHTNEGLGKILVNPAFVVDPPVPLTKPASRQSQASKPQASKLVAYLDSRHKTYTIDMECEDEARKKAKDWFDIIKKLIKDGSRIPGKTQWAAIREIASGFIAEQSKTPKTTLLNQIDQYCTGKSGDGTVKSSIRHRMWTAEVRHNNAKTSLHYEIQTYIDHEKDTSKSALVLYKAANAIIRKLASAKDTGKK